MHQEAEDEISLKEVFIKTKRWLDYLFSHKVFLLLFLTIGAAIGLLNSILKTPAYSGVLSFVLEDEKGKAGGAFSLASQFGFDLGGVSGGAFNSENLIEIMKSRRLTVETLLSPIPNCKDSSLAEMYIKMKKWPEQWNNNRHLEQLRFPPGLFKHSITQDSILGAIFEKLIIENVNVTQKDKKVSIISIEVKSENELFSKYYAEALAAKISSFYIETRSKKAKLNLAILSKQTDSVRAELNAAITGVAAANDNTFNLNAALNINRVPSARRQVDVQANTAILTELVKNLEMARVTLRKETPLIQIIDVPVLPLKKETSSKLKGILLGILFGALAAATFLTLKRFRQKLLES